MPSNNDIEMQLERLILRIDKLQTALLPQSTAQQLLTSAEAASLLGLKEQTLALWRSSGGGPEYIKTGRKVRYRPEAIQDYIENQTVPR